jgi:glycosyltransferase involved in cell wall biosynthesis
VLVGHLADGLRGRGHAVRLVTYGAIPADRPGPRAGRIVRDLALALRLWRVVRRDAIDVIHAHNYEAAIAGLVVARATRRPLVYHGHNALAEELPSYFTGPGVRRLARGAGRLLDEHVPRRADFCIAVSEELGEVLRGRGVAEIVCIPPATRPSELGTAAGAATASGAVCYAGNLDRYQNLDFLLRAFARVRSRVPHARLVVVTHAEPRHEARRIAQVGQVEGVEVVRAASYDEVRHRLAAADVAVSPRTERSGFPMKLLNYMAAGKAIVASAGSAKGLEDGVTARVVPDDDEVAFAGAVVELLEDPGLRDRLGACARQAVEDTRAWEDVLDRIEGIYRRVVAARRPPLVPAAFPERAG